MTALYCKLIIAKRKTFDEVPEKIQNGVKELLLEMGYDINGDPLDSIN